jgi:hypothetical protein
MESLLSKALNQPEITEKHISKGYMSKVIKLKAAIAQNEALHDFLTTELDQALQGQPLPKRLSKKAERMQKLDEYYTSKYKSKNQ